MLAASSIGILGSRTSNSQQTPSELDSKSIKRSNCMASFLFERGATIRGIIPFILYGHGSAISSIGPGGF
ncbi:hypothetical protein Pdw03_0903 [Penicillium digitatum]|uniref:Uncharacterized protein n=1 Tax=Penicillium digitatum TaxID=36651 RepID=A0A7T6XRD3_PENDI|nr:hypothetical protein Pdw03_0903 [Penicillium digitatum]